jgi:hypothetical protein
MWTNLYLPPNSLVIVYAFFQKGTTLASKVHFIKSVTLKKKNYFFKIFQSIPTISTFKSIFSTYFNIESPIDLFLTTTKYL